MSEPTRDNLRLHGPDWDVCPLTRHITDAEFDRIARAEGYVRLDGIDVEALREHVAASERLVTEHAWTPAILESPIHKVARQVLAALSNDHSTDSQEKDSPGPLDGEEA